MIVRDVTRPESSRRRVVSFVALAACLVAAILAASCGRARGRAATPAAGDPQIRLSADATGAATIDVLGLPADELDRLERASRTFTWEQWTTILRVQVASGASTPAVGSTERPAVLGRYAITNGVLRFTPQFPFEPGTRYEVRFHPPSPAASDDGEGAPLLLQTSVVVPVPPRRGDPTRVVDVFPTAPVLPENQLRLYIAFSAPMGLLDGAPFIHLLDDRGAEVIDPFLPLDVNLWNEEHTRYTVLFDPGRQKQGILPNEQLGRSLVAGRTYTLVVDAAWPDGEGRPLGAPFRREFRVGPAHDAAIDPADWRLEPPTAGTRDPLMVRFPRPLDHALLNRALRVTGSQGARIDGDRHVDEAETRWRFTPRDVWRTGDYLLVAAPTLEDVAGNRIGRPFEDSMLHRTSGPGALKTSGAVLPFSVRSRTQ